MVAYSYRSEKLLINHMLAVTFDSQYLAHHRARILSGACHVHIAAAVGDLVVANLDGSLR